MWALSAEEGGGGLREHGHWFIQCELGEELVVLLAVREDGAAVSRSR